MVDKFKTKIQPQEINLTSRDVAELFCSMDDQEMAMFFGFVSDITNQWDSSFCMQLQYVTDNELLTDDARRIMEKIGEYSSKAVDK